MVRGFPENSGPVGMASQKDLGTNCVIGMTFVRTDGETGHLGDPGSGQQTVARLVEGCKVLD